MIALRQTWGISQKKLRNNFERRMWIFEPGGTRKAWLKA